MVAAIIMDAHVAGKDGDPDVEMLVLDGSGPIPAVYCVDSLGAITRPIEGVGFIGSGGMFAAGYLRCALAKGVSQNKTSAFALAMRCLDMTARYAPGVAGPFDVGVVG
jgi:ATP-dependent protease HslVU (ClpYQ) peptidase subunit